MRIRSASLKRFSAHLTIATACGLLATLVLFAASVSAYKVIPKYVPWGGDLQNLWAFHNCAAKNDPYAGDGAACGDLMARGMEYPPFLYWSFVWLRAVSFDAARWLWAGVIASVVLAAPLVWSDTKAPLSRILERGPLLFVAAALVTQFPAEFAIERGNNDILVLGVLSGAVVLAARARHFGAGILVGLAVLLKVYPGFTALILGVGMAGAAIRGGRARWLALLRFVCGGLLAVVVGALAFYRQTVVFLTVKLPRFAQECPARQMCEHSIPAHFPHASVWISGAVILLWCAAACLRYAEALDLVFAGGTAAATYVARTSYDYNLVTAYPLLIVLGARAFLRPPSNARAADVVLLALGLAGVVAQRTWFKRHLDLHVDLQVAWLAGSALLAIAEPYIRSSGASLSNAISRDGAPRREARSSAQTSSPPA